MCPLYPLHIVLMYLLALCPIWFVACTLVPKAASHVWKVSFTPTELKTLAMYKTSSIIASTSDWQHNSDAIIIKALVGDPEIASVQQNYIKFEEKDNSTWVAEFNVTGKFLGYTSVSLCQAAKENSLNNNEECLKRSNKLSVSVIRNDRLLDKIFTGSVITLVSIIFINFGCALDIKCLKQAIVRPIGPVIGLVSHFLLMPLISYGLGLLLFPENHSLRLGFFFTGVSPAGGASNIWTYALGGNLNLSVTMTAVSTIASFALIPMWVFTLGSVIFAGDTLGVPYEKIITSSIGLLISLVIGYALQLYCKRIAAVMVRILKPFSAFLILFIIIFAIITKFYLFRLFTWKILVAGLILPCIGYAIGWSLANVLKQVPEDKLAICIETGVQNTGIAIFLLRFCLTEPASDITTVAPVAVALMTPLPVIIFYLVRMCRTSSAAIEEKLPTLVDEHIYL